MAKRKIPKLIVSTQDVCGFFDVSHPTLGTWIKAGCPKVAHGKFDLKAVFDWWWANLASERAAQQGGNESLNEAKRIYWWEKAKAEQHKNEQLVENLIPKERISKEWAARVSEVANGMSALENRLPSLLEGKSQAEMRQIIGEEVWSLRDQYAREGKYCPKQKGKGKK